MRKFFAILAVAIVGFLLSTQANAQEETQPKPWSYGLHFVSLHKPGTGMRTITPGVYALHSSGFTVGAYNNSHGKLSVYAGMTFQRGNWQLTTGLVTGYTKRAVLPMLAPSYRFSNGYRVSIIPNPFGESAVHISKEL